MQTMSLTVEAGVCDLCKLVSSFIKPYVDANSTQEEVKEALDALCGVLPDSLKSEVHSVSFVYCNCFT